ncbi:MAG TPA: radical SAM family heme chaperone HemW [Flavipsychrobacter sp.]|nr:radical SAM family heme chaperone HemW [Flavipsychrobacter sp.]
MAGIYVHIPFCKQRCTYCNFHFSTSLSMKDDLLQALHKEIALQRHFLQDQPVDTIYFGGGTPSLLSADEINYLFDSLQKNFPIDTLQEFTLEANPDDLTTHYLRALQQTPVNRLSIGVQSFEEADLKFMNRAHTVQQADYAIKSAQDSGFENLTLDLIYGSPQLTDAGWKNNLRNIKALNIPHFSAYALTVEEGTLLHHNIQKQKTPPLDQEKAAAQFEILMEEAGQMGYEHYEISNLSKKDCYAVHNTNYWKGIPYLGIGPSAHSFIDHQRRWNISNNALYIKSVLQEDRLNFEEETLTSTDRLNEYIMTSLRTQWGCDLQKIAADFGEAYKEELLKNSGEYREREMILLKNDTLFLTFKGKLFADRIAGELFI